MGVWKLTSRGRGRVEVIPANSPPSSSTFSSSSFLLVTCRGYPQHTCLIPSHVEVISVPPFLSTVLFPHPVQLVTVSWPFPIPSHDPPCFSLSLHLVLINDKTSYIPHIPLLFTPSRPPNIPSPSLIPYSYLCLLVTPFPSSHFPSPHLIFPPLHLPLPPVSNTRMQVNVVFLSQLVKLPV